MRPITIRKGKTFSRVLRWGVLPFVYKPITGISQTAPAVVTATGHGLVNGWKAAIISAKGMLGINAQNDPPSLAQDFQKITYIDANSVSFNGIDASKYRPYTSGGYLQYYTPVDMTGFIARGQVKDKIGGTELVLFSTSNGRIVLDNITKSITLTLSAIDTAALSFSTGIFDLELVSPGGIVTGILNPVSVIVKDEVTTSA